MRLNPLASCARRMSNQSESSDLAEPLGLENGHGSAVLGLDKPSGVSRVASRYTDVRYAT